MEVFFENKIGVLKKLTDILYVMQINIEEMNTTKGVNDISRIDLTLKIEDEDYYLFDRLLERIKLAIQEFREGRLLEMK